MSTEKPEPLAFLASEFAPASRSRALFHVLPAPLELSVSYGRGTAKGPRAILEASQQLEAFDGTGEPGQAGIHTAAPIRFGRHRAAGAVELVRKAVADVLECGACPIVLGGEHTVAAGAVSAFRDAGSAIGVLQFDAHADLRDTYEENPWSHACVMRRVLDLDVPVFQVGVRSLSASEHRFRNDRGIGHLDAAELRGGGCHGPQRALPDDFPRQLYVSFDVDVFDASLMPATGTPEPGGLGWWDAVALLDALTVGRTVVGADVVELAPAPGLHHCDYTAAKLAYTLMGLAAQPLGDAPE